MTLYLKTCKTPGCDTKIEDKYEYCFKHKKDDIKNGDLFNKLHCDKSILKEFKNADDLSKTIYVIKKKKIKSKYYYYLGDKLLQDDTYLKPMVKLLSSPSLYKAKQFVTRVTKGPGTYGIFIKNNRSKLGIGECLYIGQSLNVKNRVSQHMDNIQKANDYIEKGINHRGEIPKMYYALASIGFDKLKFVRLVSVTNRYWNSLNMHDKAELLTLMEQWEMDVFKPKYNVIKARPTDFSDIMLSDGKYKRGNYK